MDPEEIEEIREQFFEAAKLGKRVMLDKILKSEALGSEGINNRDETTEEEYTALHYAVKEGRIKTVDFLILRGSDRNAQTSTRLESPLHIACRQALKQIMTILLSRGANPNIQDWKGQTPFHVLVQKIDNKDMISTYLDHA